jgi:hypothetical protein
MARLSSSDLVLLLSDIFRMVVDMKWVGKTETVGRDIYVNDRAAMLSDNVMCNNIIAHDIITLPFSMASGPKVMFLDVRRPFGSVQAAKL